MGNLDPFFCLTKFFSSRQWLGTGRKTNDGPTLKARLIKDSAYHRSSLLATDFTRMLDIKQKSPPIKAKTQPVGRLPLKLQKESQCPRKKKRKCSLKRALSTLPLKLQKESQCPRKKKKECSLKRALIGFTSSQMLDHLTGAL